MQLFKKKAWLKQKKNQKPFIAFSVTVNRIRILIITVDDNNEIIFLTLYFIVVVTKIKVSRVSFSFMYGSSTDFLIFITVLLRDAS